MIRNNTITIMLVLVFGFGSTVNVSQNLTGIELMGNVLNSAVPQFKELYDEKGFYEKNGRPVNFFVYDLVDTVNNDYPPKLPIKISGNGIYHFSPVRCHSSYSHIAVVVSGEMEVFRFCYPDRPFDWWLSSLYLSCVGFHGQ